MIEESNGMGNGLHDAADQGDTALLRQLLDDGAYVNAVDEDGWTPLMYAAAGGHAEAVRLLLERGANPEIVEEEGGTVLMLAASGGVEAVEALWAMTGDTVDKGDQREGWTALRHAAVRGNETTVRFLLEHGAGVDVRDRGGTTPLLWAVITCDGDQLAILTPLLDAGANPNTEDDEGDFPLGRAYDTCVAELLLERGADINLAARNGGYTARISAAGGCNTPKVEFLLDHGANLEAKNTWLGHNALLEATVAGCAGTVSLLLKRGANPNVFSDSSQTAVMIAVRDGDEAITRALLSSGADVNARDETGTSVLAIAEEKGDQTIIDLLLRAGAQ